METLCVLKCQFSLFWDWKKINPRGFWGIGNTEISKSTTSYAEYLSLFKDESKFSVCFTFSHFLKHNHNISKSPVDYVLYLHTVRGTHTEEIKDSPLKTKSSNHCPLRRYRKKKEKKSVWFQVL